ncbi:HoxN/HupN/NixA family nickel/cobalt transporter [Leuconostoc gelidum subsp. aenigmaticum]|uniref:HoxN/HupN/NixA family nickel/cobalt transporter n=1 Tax=Leuconostoc gelidum TaxID=1244 RepID=UPI001CC73E71|nr:HoxN/HupN/NixA family nickel/cobalt transporter [Leuconostoc gelidum]MBZ6003687.1 HoxN/HupN/NixA family nickel/cobalt transporter [Leuconostoc gelidum subsp. aenigmaticum]
MMLMTKKHATIQSDALRYGSVILIFLIAGTLLLLTRAAQYPEMIAMAYLSFTMGLHHAFDVDHIAAIDNMTRKMLNDGKNTRGVGFSFSFGHSMVVVLMALLTVVFVEWAKDTMPIFEQIGGAIGTLIAGIMLLILASVNSVILHNIWLKFKKMSHQHPERIEIDKQIMTSKIYCLFLKLLGMIKHNWQVAFVGFLFGLGFDTATQIAVLATSATAANAGVPWYATMAFPLLFTAGMCLMDTVDGFFMSTTYNWVFSSPYRKVYYNLTITGISILAAGFIGFIDLVQAFSAMFDWHNVLTRWVAALDFNKMGLILVMMFVVTWIIAITFWHIFKLADKEDVGVITENRGK